MKCISLTVAGLAAAVAATIGLGVSQAAAADSAQAAQRSVTAVGSSVSRVAADLPVHRGKFWTHSGCVEAGQQGVDRGHWSQYQCASGPIFWNLWTDR